MTAHAELNDPRYRAVIKAGPVWLIEVELSLAGANLEGTLQANLIERAEADPVLRQELIAILTNTETTEAQKTASIMALLREFAARLSGKTEETEVLTTAPEAP
jgi:hypothetical protein